MIFSNHTETQDLKGLIEFWLITFILNKKLRSRKLMYTEVEVIKINRFTNLFFQTVNVCTIPLTSRQFPLEISRRALIFLSPSLLTYFQSATKFYKFFISKLKFSNFKI